MSFRYIFDDQVKVGTLEVSLKDEFLSIAADNFRIHTKEGTFSPIGLD